MKSRGLGLVYQPTYRNKRTGEFKTSGVWWVQYNFRGRTIRESSGSTHRPVASRLLKKRLGEIGSGRFVGPDEERLTFDYMATMLLDDYKVNRRKSLERAEYSVKRLREFFGLDHALSITTDRVNAYIKNRLEEGKAAPATVQNEIAALKRMFNLACQAGRLTNRPYIPTVRVSNVRQGFFEEAEYRVLFTHLREDLKPVATFLYWTGWRKGEVVGLQWSQVDFTAGVVRLEPGTTKTDVGRQFPFDALPELAQMLRLQREWTSALEEAQGRVIPWVFHRNGKRILDFRGAWQAACEKAGIDRTPHDFRRTTVRRLERAGVPRSVAMKLTGHKTESVYTRYAIVSEGDLREGVAKMASLRPSEDPSLPPLHPPEKGVETSERFSRSDKVLTKSRASGGSAKVVSPCE